MEKDLNYYAERLQEASIAEELRSMHELSQQRLIEVRSSDDVSGEQLLRAIEEEDYWFRMAASARLSDKIIEINIIMAEIDFISGDDSKQ